MARKKAEQEVVEEPQIINEEVKPTQSVEEGIKPAVFEDVPIIPDNKTSDNVLINVISELELAQNQIEHCEDYLNVQGADYKGYMRGKIKEWRLYKYKLRQYSIGNAPIPERPELVKDY